MKPVLRRFGDAGEDIGKPGSRIDVVAWRGDQRRHEGGPISAAIGAAKSHDFLPRSARSAALFIKHIRPSPRKDVNPAQRFSR